MQLIDIFYRIYNLSIHLPRMLRIFRADSVLRHSVTWISSHILPTYFHCTKEQHRLIPKQKERDSERKIIVSLTSFPARIDKVWMVVESLINQQQKPHKIILWLSKEQFPSIELLPQKLKKQRKRGLDIRLVDRDYRSHKKYLYAFREYPNDYVILVDDDILYPSNFISELLPGMEDGDRVNCSYGCMIQDDKFGNLMPYNSWKRIINENTTDRRFFFGSGGGTVFIPSTLNPDICNIDDAFQLCPTADDVWLNTMCRISGLKCCKVRGGLIFPVKIKDDQTLFNVNGSLSQNDIQINNAIDYCIKKYNINPFMFKSIAYED